MSPTVFPVQSQRASYVSTWGAPRSGGRSHKGTDIYAERGAPLLAVAEGWASIAESPLGGAGVAVTESDGTIYYYAHLDGYVGTFPRHVKPGEVIGTLGDSGNAKGTPHLHFEVRPKGGDKVDPAPYLARMQLARPGGELTPPPKATPAAPSSSSSSGARWKGGALLVPLVLLAIAASSKRERKPSRRRRPAHG